MTSTGPPPHSPPSSPAPLPGGSTRHRSPAPGASGGPCVADPRRAPAASTTHPVHAPGLFARYHPQARHPWTYRRRRPPNRVAAASRPAAIQAPAQRNPPTSDHAGQPLRPGRERARYHPVRRRHAGARSGRASRAPRGVEVKRIANSWVEVSDFTPLRSRTLSSVEQRPHPDQQALYTGEVPLYTSAP